MQIQFDVTITLFGQFYTQLKLELPLYFHFPDRLARRKITSDYNTDNVYTDKLHSIIPFYQIQNVYLTIINVNKQMSIYRKTRWIVYYKVFNVFTSYRNQCWLRAA